MNHFPDNDETTLDVEKAKTPHVILPQAEPAAESLEPTTSQRIEANIDQLMAGKLGAPESLPEVNVSNYDAREYARLTSNPFSNELPNDSENQYGEADPYVDPTELNQAPNMNETETPGTHMTLSIKPAEDPVDPMSKYPPAKTVDEILEKISGYQEEIEIPDPVSEMVQDHLHSLQPSEKPAGLAVEVIGSSEEVVDELPVVQIASSDSVDSDPPRDEEFPPVAWFAKTADQQITELPDTAKRKNETNRPSGQALPILDPASGESVYDVRDFSSSANGVIEPIPGGFEVEPDLFDYKTIDDLATSERPPQAPTTERPHEGKLDSFAATVEAQQLFMAGAGDLIQIDGNDGFDYIDLACFDVNSATFYEDVIVIDDQQGSTFQVQYKNVKHALFADGLEVDLKPEPPGDETTGN